MEAVNRPQWREWFTCRGNDVVVHIGIPTLRDDPAYVCVMSRETADCLYNETVTHRDLIDTLAACRGIDGDTAYNVVTVVLEETKRRAMRWSC